MHCLASCSPPGAGTDLHRPTRPAHPSPSSELRCYLLLHPGLCLSGAPHHLRRRPSLHPPPRCLGRTAGTHGGPKRGRQPEPHRGGGSGSGNRRVHEHWRGVMVNSFRGTLEDWLATTLQADVLRHSRRHRPPRPHQTPRSRTGGAPALNTRGGPRHHLPPPGTRHSIRPFHSGDRGARP